MDCLGKLKIIFRNPSTSCYSKERLLSTKAMWQPVACAWLSINELVTYECLPTTCWPALIGQWVHLPRFPLAHVRSTWANGSVLNFVSSTSRHILNLSGLISPKKLFVNAEGRLIVKCWPLRQETPLINNMWGKCHILLQQKTISLYLPVYQYFFLREVNMGLL